MKHTFEQANEHAESYAQRMRDMVAEQADQITIREREKCGIREALMGSGMSDASINTLFAWIEYHQTNRRALSALMNTYAPILLPEDE